GPRAGDHHGIGFLLASHLDPRAVLAPAPHLAAALTTPIAHLPLYTAADVAEILSDIHLEPTDLSTEDEEYELLCQAVVQATQGQVIRMEKLFRTMHAVRSAREPIRASLVTHAD